MNENTPLLCSNNDYLIPGGACCTCTIDGKYYPPHLSIFYYSGTIETILSDCWFGYYEIKCQLPVHPGEGAAFWLFGAGQDNYEEIDIFEHSKYDSKATGNMATDYSCGIWFNPEGTNYTPNEYNSGAHNYAKKYLAVSEANNLTNEHIFVKDDALDNSNPRRPLWTGSDEMIVDYVKYYQIRNNCETDVLIQNVSDWNNNVSGLNRTITIGSTSGIVVPSNTNKSLRASESITITNNGDFTIPAGAQVTFLIHDCIDYDNP